VTEGDCGSCRLAAGKRRKVIEENSRRYLKRRDVIEEEIRKRKPAIDSCVACVASITILPRSKKGTPAGFVYVAFVIDAYARRMGSFAGEGEILP
jgi:hypothetical protein